MPSSRPSLAELRAVSQPDEVIGRISSEHWAGRLYMRKVSLHLTRALLPTRITANGVTWLMIASGIAAALLLAIPGIATAAGAVVAIQLQLLFDCSDGELARWRKTTGPVGIYLDKIGHYSTEAALVAAMGLRADGGFDTLTGWTTLGCAGAALVLMNKAETDLVHVARALAGVERAPESDEVFTPRRATLAGLRRLSRFVPIYRALNALELTLLAFVAAVVDAALGSLRGSQTLAVALVGIAFVLAGGHLVSVLSSRRLR